MSEVTEINGINVAELLEFKNICKQYPSKADRDPVIVAHWLGGSRSQVEFKDKVVHLGGDDEFNPMQMFLATLAAFMLIWLQCTLPFSALKSRVCQLKCLGILMSKHTWV